MLVLQKCAFRSLALFAIVFFSPSYGHAFEIKASIENNFRLLTNEKAQHRFDRDLQERLECGNAAARTRTGRDCRQRLWSAYEANPYPVRYAPKSWTFNGDYVSNRDRNVRLSIGDLPRSRAKLHCQWVLTIEDDNRTNIPVNGADCLDDTATIKLDADRRLKVIVSVTMTRDGIAANVPAKPFEFRDVIIGTLGDSFISGEGNPQMALRYPAEQAGKRSDWLDIRCHRSLFTGISIAAFRLAQRNPTTSVTFLPMACSGAEVSQGELTANYLGRETPFQALTIVEATLPDDGQAPRWDGVSLDTIYKPDACLPQAYPGRACLLPSQLSALKAALCPTGAPCNRPDLMVLSSGGNEVGFGTVVSRAARGGNPDAKTRQQVTDGFRRLLDPDTGHFRRLHDQVTSTLVPKNVFMVGYLDPTLMRSSVYCSDRLRQSYGMSNSFGNVTFVPAWAKFLGAGVSEYWVRYAHTNILLRLNSELKQLAARHKNDNWRYVGLAQSRVTGHGYCLARGRWFNTYEDANRLQGLVATDNDLAGEAIGGVPTGAMHPNIYGHDAMAGEFYGQFKKIGLTTK
jgi:hypothetical protein